jgi:uncharacterized protein involved in exopolysaccharide biosynthesis
MLNLDDGRRAIFRPSRRRSQPEQSSDFRAYYQELAARAVLAVRRDWLLIAAFMTLGVVLALSIIPLLPRKYSATAFIIPNLYSQEQGKVVALASVDASSMVNGEARLVLSDTILQAVVARLGLHKPSEARQGSGWFRSMFFPEMTRSDSASDREMGVLRSKVEVAKDPRSYLISIAFTASSPDEAARVVNTIAGEYVRDKWMQRSRDALIAAQAELTRQRAINGDKHPKVLQAIEALDVARAELNASIEPDASSRNSPRTDEGVKLALPNRTPTSPKGTVILGLTCFLALLAGIGLAIWRDRRGLAPIDLASIRMRRLRW